MGDIAHWHQCSGCWLIVQVVPPEDGWIECYDCGEKMTDVDLRSASPLPRGVVEALRQAVAEVTALADALRSAGVRPLTVQAIIDNARPRGQRP